jgi:hypothetical protein
MFAYYHLEICTPLQQFYQTRVISLFDLEFSTLGGG